MNYIKVYLFVLIMCSLTVKVKAQNITVDVTKTPEELVKNILINSSCIDIGPVNATGNPVTSAPSYAYFNSGSSSFPFTGGIVLSTSPSKKAEGPYRQATSQGQSNDSWTGDADLNRALNKTISTQATVLEFDFVALTNSISFNYIFASNEYQTYFPCEYSDAFAFLIKEANSTDDYKNLALLPTTTTPVSSTTVHPKINPVTINGDVFAGCDAINEQFFNSYNNSNSPIDYAGQTVVMNAHTDVIPNKTYHLKLVIADDQTGMYNSAVFIEAGSFISRVNLGEDRTIANNNPVCFGQNVALDTKLDNSVYTFKWFKKDASNNYVEIIPAQTGATYNVTSAGNYKIEATLIGSTCISTGEIKIEYAPEILATNTSLFQCDDNNDGITLFNLTKVDHFVKNNAPEIINSGYYETLADAQAKTNPISTPEKYSNKSYDLIYARIENKYGCFKTAEVTLQVSNTTIADQNPIATCDGDDNQDGLYQFDLEAEVTPQVKSGLPAGITVNYYLNTDDAVTETNLLPNIFKNSTPTQIIYARAINGADCYDITPITLVVHTFDPPNFEDESKILCKGDQITLTVATGFSGYSWTPDNGSSTNSMIVNSPGDYSVTVKDVNGCEKTKKFKIISSEPATITETVVKDFSGIDNSVLIEYTGVGNYEFSLDGEIFQDNPLFTGVNPGIYYAIAKDKNGCGLSNSFLLYVLDYPRFFTPNGDGYNDLWAIKDIDQLPDYKIYIFDRYGKLLKQMNQNSTGWNGQFNSQQLPSDDYWFTLLFDNGKTVKGHFSLKR